MVTFGSVPVDIEGSRYAVQLAPGFEGLAMSMAAVLPAGRAILVTNDVVGPQCDVLHARPVVVLDVLLDLALLEPVGWFVDRHHDVGAVPHDRRRECRVLGADLGIVELLELGESEDLAVETDPIEPVIRVKQFTRHGCQMRYSLTWRNGDASNSAI